MKQAVGVCLLAGLLLTAFAVPVSAGERALRFELTVAAPLDQVWKAWTTDEGARQFFAPGTNIDATVGGHYEIYFAPSQPYGMRGADDSRVHSIVPMQSIAFTWNAPPTFGVLRSLHTLVYVHLEKVEGGRTRIHLTHTGWGEGEQWDGVFDYFSSAWIDVLARLEYRFKDGPVDWSNPPCGYGNECENSVIRIKPEGMQVDEKQWFAIIYTPRADLVQAVIDETVPAEDAAVVGRHFNYLNDAFKAGRVKFVARTVAKTESDFGIAVFHASGIEAARDFMRNDPAVAAGVFRAEVRPISLALIAGRD